MRNRIVMCMLAKGIIYYFCQLFLYFKNTNLFNDKIALKFWSANTYILISYTKRQKLSEV